MFLGPQSVTNLQTGGWLDAAGLAISDVDPVTVECDGGYVIELAGTFQPGVACTVKLKRSGDTDKVCYSGKSGEGVAPIPRRGGSLLQFVTPILPIGGDAWDVEVTQEDATTTFPAILSVVAHNWHQRMLVLRGSFPPNLRVGLRTLESEDLQS